MELRVRGDRRGVSKVGGGWGPGRGGSKISRWGRGWVVRGHFGNSDAKAICTRFLASLPFFPRLEVYCAPECEDSFLVTFKGRQCVLGPGPEA